MFCKTCGAQNADTQKFCTSCGAPLEQPQQFNQNQQFNQAPPPVFNAQFASPAGIQRREIVTAIIFSIITCGIYGLYWFYCLTEDTNKLSGDPNATSGGIAILLSIITCGIYTWYWMYKRGEIIDNYNAQRGMPGGSNSILYLVLSIIGLGIVSYCLMQNELNKIAGMM